MTAISRSQDQAPAENTLADRRRPGRLANVNRELIPILRQSDREKSALVLETGSGGIESEQSASFADPEADHLAPARGILLAVVLGSLIWMAIFLGLRSALHLWMG